MNRDPIDFLQLIVQSAYVCGDAYGALCLYNIIASKSGVTVFATGEKPGIPVSGDWETNVLDADRAKYDHLAKAIHSIDASLVTNLRGDEHPLDYQVIYFINGVIANQKIALRVEQVLHRDPEPPHDLVSAIRRFLDELESS